MSPDLSDLLRAVAPQPSRPVNVRRLVRRGRRRALAVPAAVAVGALGTAAAVSLLIGTPSQDRLDVATDPSPSAKATPTAEPPLGSGACPTTQPVADGSGQALPADFVADLLVVCRAEYRTFPGDGGWEVLVEQRSRDLAEQAAILLRQPDPQRADQRAEPGCLGSRPYFPHIVLIAADGRAVQPRFPRDECGFPDPALYTLTGPDAPLTEVAVTKLRQRTSQAEVASGCQGYKNMCRVIRRRQSSAAAVRSRLPRPPR